MLHMQYNKTYVGCPRLCAYADTLVFLGCIYRVLVLLHTHLKQLQYNHFNTPYLVSHRLYPSRITRPKPNITMKLSAVLFFAIGVFALPQDASVTSAPTSAAPIPSGLSPAISCAMACNAGDVTCQAACLGNARPNASQAIETNECAAKCDQGDGSTEASDAFAECQAACINSLFPSSQTAFGVGGGAAVAASSAAVAAASVTNSAYPTATTLGESQQKALLTKVAFVLTLK
jgi:hypothetical protein